MQYSFGPSTEACGTPIANVCASDKTEPTATRRDMPLKYDLIHESAEPAIFEAPKQNVMFNDVKSGWEV